MDIGLKLAYKRPEPQRGLVNGGIKPHGEETQEREENRSKEVAHEEVVVVAGLS